LLFIELALLLMRVKNKCNHRIMNGKKLKTNGEKVGLESKYKSYRKVFSKPASLTVICEGNAFPDIQITEGRRKNMDMFKINRIEEMLAELNNDIRSEQDISALSEDEVEQIKGLALALQASANEIFKRLSVKSDDRALTLPDPEKDRGKYELWKERRDRNETPLHFLRRVWGAHIDAGIMAQTHLRGKSGARKGLDKTLFDVLGAQCREEGKDLNYYLPNKSKQIDQKVINANFVDENEIARIGVTLQRRAQRKKDNCYEK
jgi:hypothetical protein